MQEQVARPGVPPSPWPVRVAWIFGAACLLLGGWSWRNVAEHDAVVRELERRADIAVSGTQGDPALIDMRRQLDELRQARGEATLWRRRRLGFFIAAGLLWFGAYVGGALRRLHERMAWTVRDDEL